MRKYINDKFPHFIHGADYNPEQWIATKEIWDEDMKLMKEANCNEMSVGIFSWAMLEPEEGVYDFSFLDEIIDKVYANGGRVILATYDSEFYAGMPAATVHEYGKGKAYYQAFRDTGAFWEKMISSILADLQIHPTIPGELPEGVCVHKREADGVVYLFVQNYSEHVVQDIKLGNEYMDMESGELLNKVSLNAFDVKCLKK